MADTDPCGCNLDVDCTDMACCSVNEECCCELGSPYIRELTHNAYGIIQHEAYLSREKDIEDYVMNIDGVLAYTIVEHGSSDMFKYFTVYKLPDLNHRIIKWNDLYLMVKFEDDELSAIKPGTTGIYKVDDLVWEINDINPDTLALLTTIANKLCVEVVGIDGVMLSKSVVDFSDKDFYNQCLQKLVVSLSIDYGSFIGETRPVFGLAKFEV